MVTDCPFAPCERRKSEGEESGKHKVTVDSVDTANGHLLPFETSRTLT